MLKTIEVKEAEATKKPEEPSKPSKTECRCGGVHGSSSNAVFKEHVHDFMSSTSLPGVHYIGENSRHPCERFIWLVTVIALAVLGGLEIAKVWVKWQNTPVIISFSQQSSSVASIPMPAITICPETRVRKSIVDLQTAFPDIQAKLLGKKPYESPKEQLILEAISLHCVDQNVTDHNILLEADFVPQKKHFEYLIEKVTPQMKDIFASCQWASEVVDCSKIFRPFVTMLGVCYTYNLLEDHEFYQNEVVTYADPMRVRKKGSWSLEGGYSDFKDPDAYPEHAGLLTNSFMGLQVTLRTDLEDVQEKCSQVSDAEDFRVSLTNPAEMPDIIFGDTIRMTMGTEVTVALQPVKTYTPSKLSRIAPNLRLCHFPGEKPLRLFSTYTRTNCKLECLNEIYIANCKCQVPMYPLKKDSNFSLCTPSVYKNGCGKKFDEAQTKLFSNDPLDILDTTGDSIYCGCYDSCNNLHYDYKVNFAPFKPQHTHNNSARYKHSMLNVYYQAASFSSKQRDELYNLTDFIASCGGLLGAFSGFSLVTLAEVVYFATLRLLCRVRDHRRKRDVVQPQF